MLTAVNLGSEAGILLNVVLVAAAVVVAIILSKSGLLSRRVEIDATEFAQAQTTMQRQQLDISDLRDKLEAKDHDMAERMAEKDRQIAKLTGQVETLTTMVTARDLITELRGITVRGFVAQGIPEHELVSDSP